ncbi:MAG: hypothetical protein ACLVKO_05335 [Dysgonomonas sp.]
MYSESLVLGKLARADQNGIYYDSGFSGTNYDTSLFNDKDNNYNYNESSRNKIIHASKKFQYGYYVNKEKLPDGYCVYISHIGGQGYFYSLIGKILPFDNSFKYQIYRGINVFLITLCFILFIGWVYRSFGFIPSFVTFILTFLSPWLVIYSGNGLWWSLWALYLPFITMLLLLERRHKRPENISNRAIYVALFIAVFIKCFFTGFEFVTTSFLAVFCPIIYYFWIEKKKISSFLIFSLKIGLIIILATLLYMSVLALQLSDYLGSFDSAINYIIGSYNRRTDLTTHPYLTSVPSALMFLYRAYLAGDALVLGFFLVPFKFHFAYWCLIILVSSIVIYFITKRTNDRKYIALLLTAWLSVLCPFSWYTIFRDHAMWHIHLDYILWYMPFLLYGFSVIGVCIQTIISKILIKK